MEYVARLHSPVLVVHSRDDEIIPFRSTGFQVCQYLTELGNTLVKIPIHQPVLL